MATLRQFLPGARVLDCDAQAPQTISPTDFGLVDASRSFHVFPPTKFDLVLSVSGVMEFDNTLQFFEQCKNHLNDGGMFLVSNDNLMSVRDRLSFFWLGKFRQTCHAAPIAACHVTLFLPAVPSLLHCLRETGRPGLVSTCSCGRGRSRWHRFPASVKKSARAR